jgi:hypothetical protein
MYGVDFEEYVAWKIGGITLFRLTFQLLSSWLKYDVLRNLYKGFQMFQIINPEEGNFSVLPER